MYEYNITLIRTAKNYNLQEKEVIFCHLVAAGIDRADAFYCLFQHGTTGNNANHTDSDSQASQLINNKPGIKVLISKIKNRAPINTAAVQNEVNRAADEIEESKTAAELKTREGLTKKLRSEIAGIHGKDSVQGLIQLAKLEGYDKEDTRTEEEKRKYFLPWRTKCRGCKIMQLFRELELNEEEEKSK